MFVTVTPYLKNSYTHYQFLLKFPNLDSLSTNFSHSLHRTELQHVELNRYFDYSHSFLAEIYMPFFRSSLFIIFLFIKLIKINTISLTSFEPFQRYLFIKKLHMCIFNWIASMQHISFWFWNIKHNWTMQWSYIKFYIHNYSIYAIMNTQYHQPFRSIFFITKCSKKTLEFRFLPHEFLPNLNNGFFVALSLYIFLIY